MKRLQPVLKGCLTALAMAILILDSRTAIAGAQKGVELCIQTVIPSLFPFFVLSILLTGAVTGRSVGVAAPLCRLFRIPQGAESLLAAGFLGGYPVGAQCVSQAFESGRLSGPDARRMLVICNNCGPAFLFGMAGAVFDRWYIPWMLWAIQFASALTAARILPGRCVPAKRGSGSYFTVTEALSRALAVMASVCGWVILFRVVIAFLDGWALWLMPLGAQVAVSGLLELSNGCFELLRLESMGLRFVLCAGMLNFGGLCVLLQTMAVTSEKLDRSLYFPGKVFQGCVGMILAWVLQSVAFPSGQRWHPPLVMGCLVLACIVFLGMFLRKSQNKSSIPAGIGV